MNKFLLFPRSRAFLMGIGVTLCSSAVMAVPPTPKMAIAPQGATHLTINRNHPAAPQLDQIGAATALIGRVVPKAARRFVVGALLPQDKSGLDRFALRDLPDGRIQLRGTSGVAVASALNWYLQNRAGCLLTWSGDQLNLPAQLPAVGAPLEKTSPYKRRLFFNYCTLSYTGAWWDWARWQREIDFLALQGINMPLAPVGLEAVWYNTLVKMGWTDAEARQFLVGPSFFAWQWMTNIEGHMGPLPKSWIDSHITLGQQILRRERELGMKPVQQGFTGWVPRLTMQKFPDAQIKLGNPWASFPQTAQMDPLDPLFARFGRTFLEEQNRLFGTSHFYGADPFHEGTPPVAGDEYLEKVGGAIWKLLSNFDPDATWVMQAWSIRKPIATQPPADRLLVLDLNGSKAASNENFWGRPFVTGTLHNFGGRINMHGDLKAEIDNQRGQKALKSPNCVGTGFFMEGTEQNPAYYTAALDMLWEDEPLDFDQWLARYAHNRYGATSQNALDAWKILANGPYGKGTSGLESSSMIAARPALVPTKSGPNNGFKIPYDPAQLVTAWQLLLRDSATLGKSEGYRFDVMDLGRQVLSNLTQELHKDVRVAYMQGDVAAFDRATLRFQDALRDTDRLLNTRGEYQLGRQIKMARQWGKTDAERNLYEANQRTLVSLWGPVPGTTVPLPGETSSADPRIFDYSWREWGGLIGQFYLPRWQKLHSALRESLVKGEKWPDETMLPQAHGRPAFRANAFYRELADWETGWSRATGGVPLEPQGDTLAISRELLAKWQPIAAQMYGAARLGAMNDTQRSQELSKSGVGEWTPTTAKSQWTSLRFDLTNAVAGEGQYQVVFSYRSGGQAFLMRNVQLLANGEKVDEDAHEGWTGNTNRNNIYVLRLPQHAFGTKYELVFEGKTDGSGASNGIVLFNKQ